MQATPAEQTQLTTAQILLKLGIPVHRAGFEQLCIAIPHFAQDKTQSMNSELYPFVANALNYSDGRAVEHSIRGVIVSAWETRDPKIWAEYFPNCKKAPSNKQFIATLAEYIK